MPEVAIAAVTSAVAVVTYAAVAPSVGAIGDVLAGSIGIAGLMATGLAVAALLRGTGMPWMLRMAYLLLLLSLTLIVVTSVLALMGAHR